MKISGIVIASGEGKRIGRIKQLLPWKNSTILGNIIDTLKDTDLDKIYIVLGHEKEEILENIKLHLTEKFEVIFNENYKKGMLTSIQEAVKKIPDDYIGFIIFLGDQPFIKKETVERFIERIKVGDYPIIVSCYKGERGHPTFISLDFKEKILSLDPEKDSLRDIIYDARNKDLVYDFETDDEDVIKDIDTYEDYIREKEAHNA
ncbi:MAG TPA: nucleotidyltransferase family protein [Caldisericia bacterium]|nr:nucleotidyltransferase family protein [Caldisericia bacterium]HPB33473.1 nucleotidyltransferase family protein [Caldisericia bacterium]HQL66539.1 nucleotidyltransferase family protein [Caldisericia bacterium]HQN49247.1 nucleotidyltransferase family protein [Caldisericia bacterium]HQO99265.1 nucleotidyltransferase family protein [Caldisericia bacterium]